MSPVHDEPTLKQLGGSPIRRKRKLVSSGGQKWFKGSPRKKERSSQLTTGRGQVIGNAAVMGGSSVELSPARPVPSTVVQFTLKSGRELQLSIYDQIPLVSKDGEGEFLKNCSFKRWKSWKDKGDKLASPPLPTEDRPLPQPNYRLIPEYSLREAAPLPNAYIRWMDDVELGDAVEYHVDEEDSAWLDLFNSNRDGVGVALEVMELLMDRLEKESYLQMQSSGLDQRPVIDDDAVCCICMDGECQNSNAILFCDMCNLAVHQECYGVPYIPEGQWLCRRCLQSPSREVECVLCPNKGGAFKQTDDGRWAHVVCAIWIPEVCFANTVFLEPVDSVNNIPPARWRLCCFICKYKGRGACIQCHKSNCYIAFHVTCAQHAGLCMRMDTVRIGSTVTVRKTAYCDNHAPPDFIRQTREGDASPTVRQKLKACRKMLAEKRSAKPTVSIPTIPPERVTEIASSVSFAKKNVFIKRLLSYWKLKRIQRNGVPLLRRLQAASNHPPSHHRASLVHDPNSGAPDHSDHAWKFLVRLRQDLEKTRLLCELIRKREKQKRELIYLRTDEWSYKATPYVQFLTSVLDELGSRDPQGIFAEPVDPEAVPDYESVINCPMDLSTMRQKATTLFYDSLFEMKLDFQLMIDNCLLYNSKDTIFHRSALRLQELGRMIFREAERVQEQIGFDLESGLHLDKTPVLNVASNSATTSHTLDGHRQSDHHIFEEMDILMKDEDRIHLPLNEHMIKLDNMMDKVLSIQHPGARKKRYDKLYREIQRVRKLARMGSGSPRPKSPPRSPKRESTLRRMSSSPVITPSARKLRRKSTVEINDDAEIKEEVESEAIKARPPKRRVVQEMEAKTNSTPIRRTSRSIENSPTHHSTPPIKNTSTAPTPLRRTTRLSLDSDRVTRTHASHLPSTPNPTPTKPIVNGLMRNGTRNSTKSGRRAREVSETAPPSSPILPRSGVVDSFSVYRDTERDSSDGEEQNDNNEEEQEDEDNPTEEDDDSSSEEGDSDSDSEDDDEVSDGSSDAGAANHHRTVVTRNSSALETTLGSRGRAMRHRRDSSASSSSSSSSSSGSSDGQVVQDGNEQPAKVQEQLTPDHLKLVWVRGADEAWTPALIVDPDASELSSDKNGISIPTPPDSVLSKRPPAGRRRKEEMHLVLFFDKNSTWEWVPLSALEPLGQDPDLDNLHIQEGRANKRKWVQKAFEKATRMRILGLVPPLYPASGASSSHPQQESY